MQQRAAQAISTALAACMSAHRIAGTRKPVKDNQTAMRPPNLKSGVQIAQPQRHTEHDTPYS